MDGNGTVNGLTMSDATIAPGFSAGQLTFTDDLLLGNNSVLEFELGGFVQGTEYDFLNVMGTAALDGDLDVSFLDGFDLLVVSGDMFTLLTAALLTGEFDNVLNGGSLVTSDGLGTFFVYYGADSPFDPNSVVLSEFNATAVPEPSQAMLLLSLGGLFTTYRVRRRRRKPQPAASSSEHLAS